MTASAVDDGRVEYVPMGVPRVHYLTDLWVCFLLVLVNAARYRSVDLEYLLIGKDVQCAVCCLKIILRHLVPNIK